MFYCNECKIVAYNNNIPQHATHTTTDLGLVSTLADDSLISLYFNKNDEIDVGEMSLEQLMQFNTKLRELLTESKKYGI